MAQPPSYDACIHIASCIPPIARNSETDRIYQKPLDEAMVGWYQNARVEFGGLMSEDVAFKDARFK